MHSPAFLGVQLGVPRAISPLELAAPQRVLKLGDACLHKGAGDAPERAEGTERRGGRSRAQQGACTHCRRVQMRAVRAVLVARAVRACASSRASH